MVDGGSVLTQPAASALHVPAAEAQPQPPAKRLRPDAGVLQRTNHNATVHKQPTLSSPSITSERPESSYSKVPNENDFIVNPASLVSFAVVQNLKDVSKLPM